MAITIVPFLEMRSRMKTVLTALPPRILTVWSVSSRERGGGCAAIIGDDPPSGARGGWSGGRCDMRAEVTELPRCWGRRAPSRDFLSPGIAQPTRPYPRVHLGAAAGHDHDVVGCDSLAEYEAE